MDKLYKCKTPVLLIVFNRPITTEIVFEAIRKAQPEKLYIASDGPRVDRFDDIENCTKVKEIITKVDWKCDVKYNLNESNLGCGLSPSNAISWVFNNEDRAIILEDDCVPVLSFFKYCEELLERYLNDDRIGIISGNNINEERTRDEYSYFFCRYAHSWGWATWRRVWVNFDFDMALYPTFLKEKHFNNIFENKNEISYYNKFYSKGYNDAGFRSHVWDFQFSFSILSGNRLNIVPKKNLVTNIGYMGTHSETRTRHHDIKADADFSIQQHPVFILRNKWYDDYHFKNHIFRDFKWYMRLYWLFVRGKRKIKKVLILKSV